MATLDAPSDDALQSLTGALVDANDRLLGLLSLITNDPPTSLEAAEMIDSIVERAASILDLNQVTVDGVEKHVWTASAAPRSLDAAVGEWSTSIRVQDLGTVEVLFERQTQRFDTGDAKLLAAVARLLANAIATAHVHRKALAQQVVAREHTTAAQVAAAALPDMASLPQSPALTLFAHLTPARETGGDLFTWQQVGDSVWFVIGDVSGKGLPAAVLMSTVVSAVEASITRSHEGGPVAVVAAVDRWLHERLSNAAMFVTLAIGEWNAQTNELTMANSGHSPIVWASGGTTQRVEATAPPIGVILGCEPSAWVRTTTAGDLLVLATDGLTEQHDVDGALFGEDHFDERVAALQPLGEAHEVGESLLAEVAAHGEGCVQSDDRALMVLSFS